MVNDALTSSSLDDLPIQLSYRFGTKYHYLNQSFYITT